MDTQASQPFEGWCIVEIMGHQTFAGYVTERAIAGAGLLQIDVPAVDDSHPAFTKLFSPSSIYGITPTTEEHARQAASQIRVRPVTLYILPNPPVARRALTRREMDEIDPDAEYERSRDDYGNDTEEEDEQKISF